MRLACRHHMSECAGGVQGDDLHEFFVVDACKDAVLEPRCLAVSVVTFADVYLF